MNKPIFKKITDIEIPKKIPKVFIVFARQNVKYMVSRALLKNYEEKMSEIRW